MFQWTCLSSDYKTFSVSWYQYPQALHTYRINLSPFTKDFRVWGAPIETNLFILELPSGNFLIDHVRQYNLHLTSDYFKAYWIYGLVPISC